MLREAFKRAVNTLPTDLPEPSPPQQCNLGGTASLVLADSSQVRYGPCTKPVAIQRALNVLFAVLNNASVNREVIVPDVVGDSVPKGWVLVATAGLAPAIKPADVPMSRGS